jgi:hypothetical protein
MTFQPVVPLGGFAGWAFLKRTAPVQQAAFERAPALAREEAYFRARIGAVRTADALVADRRLLRVALGAFGLEGDAGSTAFIRKVLAEGTLTEGAFANRLADKQYAALSRAFGFGDFAVPRTQLSDFADDIVAAWKTRRFEAAVGQQDNRLRLALNAERELSALAGRSISEEAKWFTIMGNRPLREVFETALRLPAGFGALDLDRQLQTLRDKTAAALGSQAVAQFANPARTEALVRRFLTMAGLSGPASGGAASGPGAAALALLQAAVSPR